MEGRAGREAGGADWYSVFGNVARRNAGRDSSGEGPGCEGQLCRALYGMSPVTRRNSCSYRGSLWSSRTQPQVHVTPGCTHWFQVERVESYPLVPTFQKELTSGVNRSVSLFQRRYVLIFSNRVIPFRRRCSACMGFAKTIFPFSGKSSSYIFYCFSCGRWKGPF